MLNLMAALLMLWLPCDSQIKPAAIEGYEYDDLYWSSMGGEAALDLPLFGPGPGGAPQDYAHGAKPTTFGSGVTWQPSTDGQSLKFDGTSNGKVIWAPPTGITSTTPYTIGIRAKFNGTPSLLNMLSVGDGADILLAYWWNDGNGLTYKTSFSNGYELSSNPDITKWHWWIFRCKNATTSAADVFCDGANLTLAASSGVSSVSTSQLALSAGASGGLQAPMSVAGMFAVPAFWSDGQIAAFYNRPWSRFTRRQAVFGVSATYPASQPIIVPPEPFPFSAFNYL